MSQYTFDLTEREEAQFSGWWRNLSIDDQTAIRGEVIEPAGFVSPYEWFESLEKSDRCAWAVNWDECALDCDLCPNYVACHGVWHEPVS